MLLEGASLKVGDALTNSGLTSVKHLGRMVIAEYGDGTRLQLRIWQKSLVVDVSNITGLATELNFGQLSGLTEPRTIPHPCP